MAADGGASHHVTTDLNNLSLHAPYTGSDDVMIGDGTGLLISHTGSASLPSSTTTFTLNDVLYVPSMKKNLISISQFATLIMIFVRGNTLDGAQLASSPILAFSHVKTTSSNWHHRLGHPLPFSISSLHSTNPLEIIFSMYGLLPFYHKMVSNIMLFYPNWRQAMSEEYDALVRNGTWELKLDGSIAVQSSPCSQGLSSKTGVDYHETFSPVVKPTTVRLVLSGSRKCIYGSTTGFVDSIIPHMFVNFIKLSMASNKLPSLVSRVALLTLGSTVSLKDLSPLSYFLGVEVVPHRLGIRSPKEDTFKTYSYGPIWLMQNLFSPPTNYAYLVYLGRNLVSWSSKKQQTVARSSTEAEYRSVAATAAELCWVGSLLSDLGINFTTSPVVYCDNVGATQLSSNPIFHSRMKHVAIDYHFIRDQVHLVYLSCSCLLCDRLADLLTKPRLLPNFTLRDKIGLSTRGLS
ncbi:hypothetical protein AAG906_016608 [Vitis piasezkii]